MSQRADKTFRIRNIAVLAGLLIAMWIPALGFGYYVVRPLAGITVPAVMVVGLILCVRWKSFAPFVLVVASPITLTFVMGVADWYSVRPQFVSMGLPSMTACNLDPKTRCYYASGGCVVAGGEWVFLSPRNAGLKLMCAMFGQPRQTYHGPYPSIDEALALVANATKTATKDFLDGKVGVNGKQIMLGRKMVDDILFDFGNAFAGADVDGFTTDVQADIYREQCLVVRVRTVDGDSPETGTSDGIYLFDANTLKPFARFVLAGDAGRIPKLLTRFSNGD